ncbi:MAG TPA: hypothetical protein VJB05_02960, partial [archaeon]|nr:hypothetical protein [archaeon]
SGEQCELPYTENNAKCTQTRNTCQDKLYGLRDALGFCDTSCGCIYDQYEFSCTRGQCGAICADGETRTVILNTTLGSCSCTQQCGYGCEWDPCYCEPGTGGGGPVTGSPAITVSHMPQNPTSGQVTLTATGANLTQIEIYVDGFVVTSCSSSPCILSATYTAGVHSYYARASNSFAVRTDPADGAKSFTIPSTTGTSPVNGTNTTTSGSVSLTISHVPATPKTVDTVTITASASINANRVEIYVDGVLSKICTDFICSLESTYSAGTHNYFGIAYDSIGSVTNPATGTKSFTVTQATGAQNVTPSGPPGPGTTNIVLDVSQSPINPTTQDSVRITAVASGPNSFREINVYIDDVLKKTCTNYASAQPCSWASLYSQGEHTYYAFVTDVSGATKRDPVSGSKNFVVTGSSSTPGTPGPAPPAPGPGPTQPNKTATPVCYARIQEKNCTYNSATRRYDISLTGSWANGTHAHWDIADDPDRQVYLYNYTRIKPVAGPGWNTVKIAVHNVNDTQLCADTSTVYCGPGTSTGKNVDVIFDVKDVLNTGVNTVKIIVVPYVDISYIRVYSYTENTLNVTRPWVEGNTSLAGISGPVSVVENKTYDVFAMSTNLAATKNVSLVYNLQTNRPGKYTLIAVANYSGKSERYTKTITVTNCPKTYKVYARSDNDNTICMEFSTPCDVPAVGWTLVERCDTQEQPIPSAGFDFTWIIILIIIVLLVLLAYKYRDRIRERTQRPRRTFKEELPSFE